MRLELTFPAKGHYNESQDISNLHSVLDHPIVFLSQITDKNQNPHFRNIFKEVSSVFSMYHFKRTNRNLKNIMLRQIGQSVLSAKKGRGTRKGSITIIFLKGGRYSE